MTMMVHTISQMHMHTNNAHTDISRIHICLEKKTPASFDTNDKERMSRLEVKKSSNESQWFFVVFSFCMKAFFQTRQICNSNDVQYISETRKNQKLYCLEVL